MNFDLSCFSIEFQNYVLKHLNCENYYDFINKYQNDFILNIIPKTTNESQSNSLLEVDILNKTTSNNEEVIEDNFFKYFIENEKIYLKSLENLSKNKKRKLRDHEGVFLKNTNCWSFPLTSKDYILENLKPKNETFEILEEEDEKEELKTDKNIIQNFYFQDNKAFLIPTLEHPQYGKSVIYDKTGNMGIWSVKLKGWIFQKETL